MYRSSTLPIPDRKKLALALLAVAFVAVAVPGAAMGGPPSPLSAVPGDCNGDQLVSAPDTLTLAWEIMDGDGTLAVDTPGGSYRGNIGCDGNEDAVVDAGDVACVVLLLFDGPGSCDP